MKFTDGLIISVQACAPEGVIFEEAEVVEALTMVLSVHTDYGGTYGTAVERAAYRMLREANPPPPRSRWRRFLDC